MASWADNIRKKGRALAWGMKGNSMYLIYLEQEDQHVSVCVPLGLKMYEDDAREFVANLYAKLKWCQDNDTSWFMVGDTRVDCCSGLEFGYKKLLML